MAKGWAISTEARKGVADKALEIVSAAGGGGEVVESTMRAIEWLDTAPTIAEARRMRKADLLEAYRHAVGAADVLCRATIVLNATALDGSAARSETSMAAARAKVAKDADGKQAAKARVRELWDELPEADKVKRGSVLRFATATAPKVSSSTVDGIKKWVADWRKEKRSS